jgi:hypothetical protein
MVESNKIKVVEEYCYRLKDQIQEIHQELGDSMTKNKE